MAANIPKTQKAIIQPDERSTTLARITLPVPVLAPGSTEHLVRVHTTAFTNGELLWSKNFPLPTAVAAVKIMVPCFDVAGTIVTCPPSSPFKPGTEVYARANYAHTGCAREYTILLTEEISRRPQGQSWVQSAATPMSAETAWQALFVEARLAAVAGQGARGKRVFVTGAAGGVGVWVVQFAKWAGAVVVASCRGGGAGLGADEVVDYTTTDVREWARGDGRKVDLVVDCIGRKALEDGWWTVKEGGQIISIFQPPEQMRPAEMKGDIKNHFFIMESNGEQLQKITRLIESGIGKPAVDSVFQFDQFQEARERLESGKTRGKVVLNFGPN